MGAWLGNWFSGTPSGSSSPSYPVLANATTAEAIRDRILTVIEALTPSICSADKFHRYRNEDGADFQEWCEANPQSSLRRVQVRDTGNDAPPAVSNTDIERRNVEFRILVAYPQTARTGKHQALDRDDAMSSDQHAIEKAVGLQGRANFSGSYPDATWLSGTTDRIVGDGVDLLEIVQTMTFNKQQS